MVHDSRWCGEEAAVYDTPTLAPAGDDLKPYGKSTPRWGLSGVGGAISQVGIGRFCSGMWQLFRRTPLRFESPKKHSLAMCSLRKLTWYSRR